MIPFFRKIRKKLADENAFIKYSRYAIGEIVLVVIGILIALQINNWNEQRKLYGLKTIYIERLLDDLKQDTLKIDLLIQGLDNNQHIIKTLINDVDSSLDPKTLITSIENFFQGGWNMADFTPNKNTYSDLSQTGNMKVFKGSELSISIKNYYVSIETKEKEHNINKDWITPLDVDLARETSAFEFDPNTKALFQKNDSMIALKSLLDNKILLKRNAAGHYWFNQALKKSIIDTKNLATDLMNTLQTELNK